MSAYQSVCYGPGILPNICFSWNNSSNLQNDTNAVNTIQKVYYHKPFNRTWKWGKGFIYCWECLVPRVLEQELELSFSKSSPLINLSIPMPVTGTMWHWHQETRGPCERESSHRPGNKWSQGHYAARTITVTLSEHQVQHKSGHRVFLLKAGSELLPWLPTPIRWLKKKPSI